MSSLGKYSKYKYLSSVPTSEYSSTYNLNVVKSNAMEYELEQARETIMKLRNELTNKNKEIALLKVNKNRGEGDHMKTIKILEEILKTCDKNTKKCIYEIEDRVYNEENYNTLDNNNEINSDIDDQEKMFFVTEQNFHTNVQKKYTKRLPKLFLNKKQQNAIKETLYINTLKQQLNSVNEELIKKTDELEELKKNSNPQNFSKLESKYKNNFNELSQIKKENEKMKSKISDVTQLLTKEKDDNTFLKNKLKEYNGKFHDFREKSSKKTQELENKLSLAMEKQRECKIFHIKRGGSESKFNTNNYEGEKNNDERLDAAENEIKQMSKIMTLLKKQKSNKEEEVKKLNEDKKELFNDKMKLKDENKKINREFTALKKKYDESKQQIIKLQKENDRLRKQKEDAENKVDSEQNKINAVQELLDESENENKKLKNEIIKLKKEIEELKKMINDRKDDFFFTEVKIEGNKKNDLEVSIIPKNDNSEDYEQFLKNSNNKLTIQSDSNLRYSDNNNQNNKLDENKNNNKNYIISEKSGEIGSL